MIRRIRKLLQLLVPVLACSACVGAEDACPPDLPLLVGTDDARVVDAVWMAETLWQDGIFANIGDRPDLFAIVPEGQGLVKVVLDDEHVGRARADVLWDGYGTVTSCTITLHETQIFGHTLAHELGHCMGLWHDDAYEFPDSIMNRMSGSTVYMRHVWHLLSCTPPGEGL